MKLEDLPDSLANDPAFPHNMNHYWAVFNPVKRDDLRPEMLQYVDKVVELMYGGTNDDYGTYPGEITFMIRALDWHGDLLLGWSGYWVPLTDLDVWSREQSVAS